jgi:hypothetical protein
LYLWFDGVDDRLQAAFALSVGFDRVSRVQVEAWKADAQVFGGDAGILLMRPSSPSLTMYSGANGPTVPVSLTQPTIVTEHFFGSASYVVADNGFKVPGAAGVDAPTNSAIGGSVLGGYNANMRWYGSMVVDRQLTEQQLGWLRFYFSRAPLPLTAIVSGDSTVADNGGGQPAIATFLPDLSVIASIATPGDNIAGQRGKFAALSTAVQQSARVFILQLLLNEMDPAVPAAVTLAAFQSYIDFARSRLSPQCLIVVGTMVPAGNRWAFFSADPAVIAARQAKWEAMNKAIAGFGPNAIVGVDARVTAHTRQMARPIGYLASELDSGDGIHPTSFGRRINAACWRSVLAAQGLLSGRRAAQPAGIAPLNAATANTWTAPQTFNGGLVSTTGNFTGNLVTTGALVGSDLLQVRGNTANTAGTVQFTNNAGSAEWAKFVAQPSGAITVTAPGGMALAGGIGLNLATGGERRVTFGDAVSYIYGSTAYVGLYDSGNARQVWQYDRAGNKLNVYTTALAPGFDNAQSLGLPAARWSQVYAGAGTISTSDARTKDWRGGLDADELAAATVIAGSIGVYRFLDAIRDKGDAARLHVGVLAQQVVGIMLAHGLDPDRYAFICHDQWEEVPGTPARDAVPAIPAVPETPARKAVRRRGKILQLAMPAIPSTPEIPGVPAVPAGDPIPAGDRYGIRYEELAMFLAAAQEQRLAAIEAKLAA